MKYNIEGNINFFNELYESLDVEDNNEDNLCLITNTVLTDRFVKMNCNHRFNYIALYKDILNHKKKFNNMESMNSLLSNNEIRCPYCRTKQEGVLPYYEDLNLPKINGVNFFDADFKNPKSDYISNYSYQKCEFLIPCKSFNSEMEESKTNAKHIKCYKVGSYLDDIDNKHYCFYHKQSIIKTNKKNSIIKAKEEAKKIKDELKKTEKLKIKESKELLKSSLKKKNTQKMECENIILGSITINTSENNTGCIKLLKYGKNKGKECSEKIFDKCLCKRHYNLENKVINNDITNDIKNDINI